MIEFANGLIEMAKKPLPKPPKPEATRVTEEVAAQHDEAGEVTGVVSATPEPAPEPPVTAAAADRWVYVRPGTEGLLALAMAHTILNEGLASGPVPFDQMP